MTKYDYLKEMGLLGNPDHQGGCEGVFIMSSDSDNAVNGVGISHEDMYNDIVGTKDYSLINVLNEFDAVVKECNQGVMDMNSNNTMYMNISPDVFAEYNKDSVEFYAATQKLLEDSYAKD